MNRFRLIPTRGMGRYHSLHVFGEVEDALVAAREFMEELDVPIMICAAPEGGLVRPLDTVKPKKKR